jgi:hypothetical protein
MIYYVEVFKRINDQEKELYIRSPIFTDKLSAISWVGELDFINDNLYCKLEEENKDE